MNAFVTLTKLIILIFGLSIISFSLLAQDAKSILKSTYDKCQSVQNGTFEMTRFMKYMSSKDTTVNAYQISFKKNKADTLHATQFHINQFLKDKLIGETLYTGDELAITNMQDSTASIISKTLYAKEIKSRIRNQKFYFPLMNIKSTPLPDDDDLKDSSYIYKFIGIENINNVSCYHIQTNEIPENKSSEMMKNLRTECHYWINKADMIPIQYSIAHDVVMNNDTMYQYELNKLTKYEINNLDDEKILTLSSIPAYYKVKDFVPYTSQPLLPKDTVAPDWALPSLSDEMISLKNLKGKLVLVDFFYKSCYPCMLALPGLQALHTKFQDKGLAIVGINPVDKKEDDIAAFLAKRGVTYPVLLEGKTVANEYRVSGYPTIYLIDKNSKIIYIQEGYSKEGEKTLEDLIEKLL